jgi:Ca-activated chloride channel homolog
VSRDRLVAGLLVLLGGCGRAGREARRGAELYAADRFDEAAAAFAASLAVRPDSAVSFRAGNALYRMHRYELAVKRYEEAGGRGRDARSAYNLGNAWFRAAEEHPEDPDNLPNAIRAFEDALRLDPSDADAKWNLELAVKRLEDDRLSGGSSGRMRNADYGRGNQRSPGYQGNDEQRVGAMAGGGMGSGEGESAEELDDTQARQLLESVEREQLSAHEGRPNLKGRSEGRDW